jgi:methylated-DNA-[protein]-cysteine S-methyltransferase
MTSDLSTVLGTALSEGASAIRSLTTLRARLARDAEATGLLDVAYRVVDSPFGGLLLAATEVGLVRVAFETEDHGTVLQTLSDTISPRVLQSSGRTEDAARQLEDYFAQRRRKFEVAVDLRLIRGFRREVVARLSDIAYGTTASYGEVAKLTTSPAAVRAVGSACSHNPVPIVIPCHRVVRSDGTLGQYLGGVDVKAALIAMETSSYVN